MNEPTLTKEQLAFVKRSLADGPIGIPSEVLRPLIKLAEWALAAQEHMGTDVHWKGIKETLDEHDALCVISQDTLNIYEAEALGNGRWTITVSCEDLLLLIAEVKASRLKTEQDAKTQDRIRLGK